jgi:uracil-DNA glycosylase
MDRDDVLELVRATRRRLQWEREGGVEALPRAAGRRRLRAAEPAPTATEPEVAAPASRDGRGAAGLKVVREELGDCQRCKLAPRRTHIVFGVGSATAPLVFVGEAPGENEDRQGEPFVGMAGDLLTKMIGAMGFTRDEVYICNVIKCRPPGNRNPEPDEIAACEPFLVRQLGAIAPRVIVTLGKFAAQALLKTSAPISSLRGQWKRYQGIALMPTFHPAFLLRNPSAKREVWDDLKKVMAELDRLGIARGRPAGP